MVDLPNEESLGPMPQADWRYRVIAPDVSPIARGNAELGRGIDQLSSGLASGIETQNRAQNALQDAKAQSQFLIGQQNISNAAKNETDPANLPQYNDKLTGNLATAAGSITDPNARATFLATHAPTVNAAQLGLKDQSFNLNKGIELASAQDDLDKLKNQGVAATDDATKTSVVNAGLARIKTLADAGYLDPQAAQRLRQSWVTDYAKESLAMLSPQQRLAALQPVDTGAASKQAYDFFVSKGWSKEQSSAIVGALAHEGGLNPNSVNPGDGADGSDSVGIAQWNSGRAQALKAFAGDQWNTLPGQLAFVDHELRSSEGAAGQQLSGAKTVEQASEAMLQYERPKGFEGGPATALGWSNRLRQSQGIYSKFANGVDPGAAIGSHLVQFIPESTRLQMATDAGNQIDTAARQETATVKSLMGDDTESLMTTGKPVDGLDPSRVGASMGPDAANEFAMGRGFALGYYNATKDWSTLPTSYIEQRADSLKPQPGSVGFDLAEKYHQAALTAADKITKGRLEDPAGSVDKLPDVKAATQAAGNDPTKFQTVIKARLKAQDAIGIAPEAQSPITQSEAKTYAASLQPVSHGQMDVAGQAQQIEQVAKSVDEKFGPYAQQAMQRILYHVTMKPEAADVLAAALIKYAQGGQAPFIDPQGQFKLQNGQAADVAGQIAGQVQAPQTPAVAPAQPARAPDAAAPAPASHIVSIGRGTMRVPGMNPNLSTSAPTPPQRPFTQAQDMLKSDPARLITPFIQKFGVDAVPPELRGYIPATPQQGAAP